MPLSIDIRAAPQEVITVDTEPLSGDKPNFRRTDTS